MEFPQHTLISTLLFSPAVLFACQGQQFWCWTCIQLSALAPSTCCPQLGLVCEASERPGGAVCAHVAFYFFLQSRFLSTRESPFHWEDTYPLFIERNASVIRRPCRLLCAQLNPRGGWLRLVRPWCCLWPPASAGDVQRGRLSPQSSQLTPPSVDICFYYSVSGLAKRSRRRICFVSQALLPALIHPGQESCLFEEKVHLLVMEKERLLPLWLSSSYAAF